MGLTCRSVIDSLSESHGRDGMFTLRVSRHSYYISLFCHLSSSCWQLSCWTYSTDCYWPETLLLYNCRSLLWYRRLSGQPRIICSSRGTIKVRTEHMLTYLTFFFCASHGILKHCFTLKTQTVLGRWQGIPVLKMHIKPSAFYNCYHWSSALNDDILPRQRWRWGERLSVYPRGRRRHRGACTWQVSGVCSHGATGVHPGSPFTTTQYAHEGVTQPCVAQAPPSVWGECTPGGKHCFHHGRTALTLLSCWWGLHVETLTNLCNYFGIFVGIPVYMHFNTPVVDICETKACFFLPQQEAWPYFLLCSF